MASSKSSTRISPSDIETKLKSLQGGVQDKVEDQKSNVMIAAGVAAFVLVVVFYLLGRRAGLKRSTLVEIRRV